MTNNEVGSGVLVIAMEVYALYEAWNSRNPHPENTFMAWCNAMVESYKENENARD